MTKRSGRREATETAQHLSKAIGFLTMALQDTLTGSLRDSEEVARALEWAKASMDRLSLEGRA